MSKIKNKTTFKIILFFSIFSLFSAYFIEYVLNHKPCNLCLFERIPYILTTLIIILILTLKKFEKIALILISLIFISSTFLSFYHLGIEQGFISESSVCNLNNDTDNLSKEDLLKELKEKTVSCKDVTFRIFGISLATINTITSFILCIITVKLFLNYEKN